MTRISPGSVLRCRAMKLSGLAIVTVAVISLSSGYVKQNGTASAVNLGRHQSASMLHVLRTANRTSAATDCQPLAVFSQPPAGFDPTTATDAQLQQHGFPRQPAGDPSDPTVQAAQQVWLNAVRAVKTFVPPDPVCGAVFHDPWVFSGYWAGHVAPQSDYGNANFNWSQSEWVQPSVAGNSNYTNYQTAPDASFWVGTGITSLVQAGADSIATSTPQYRFWTEDYPAATVWEGPVINPGNTAFVYEQYEGSSEAYYFLENVTTGSYSSFTNSAPYNGFKAANFINERMNGLYLPKFADVSVSSNYFGNSNNTWALSSDHNNRWVMTSNCTSGGTILSEPTAVASDNSFTQRWYASSPYNNTCLPPS